MWHYGDMFIFLYPAISNPLNVIALLIYFCPLHACTGDWSYGYIYVYVCVCVCVCTKENLNGTLEVDLLLM